VVPIAPPVTAIPTSVGESMGRVEEIGYVSVPFRLPASSTMGKSSSISYSSPYCHSKRRRTYVLAAPRDRLVVGVEQRVRVAVEVVDIEPDRHRQTDPTDPVGVREDPRVRGLAGHHAPPEDDGVVHLLVHLLGDAPVLLIRDVVRRPRGEPVGGGVVRGEYSSRTLFVTVRWGGVGEYDEVRADRVAGGEFDDVSGVVAFGRDSGVGVDAADRHARAVLGAGVFSARSRSQSSKRARWKV